MRYLIGGQPLSSFYWTLNDNSYKTGSLFNGPHSQEKLTLVEQVLIVSRARAQ